MVRMPIEPLSLPARIETERLVIRMLVPADAEALHDAVTARIDALRPWMEWIAFEPQTVDQRRELIETWQHDFEQGRGTAYGIFADGQYVGNTGLMTRQGPDVLEIGYWAAVEGHGYMTEATIAQALVAFEHCRVPRVEIHCDPRNTRSAAVAKRAGFTLGATVPATGSDAGYGGRELTQIWEATRESLSREPLASAPRPRIS